MRKEKLVHTRGGKLDSVYQLLSHCSDKEFPFKQPKLVELSAVSMRKIL